MTPRIVSGQLVRVAPRDEDVKVGDIVLAKVKGQLYLHKVSAIQGWRVQISNNHGHINGWTTQERIYGVVVTR
jgi:SOS-response transcriptional repressor LexA